MLPAQNRSLLLFFGMTMTEDVSMCACSTDLSINMQGTVMFATTHFTGGFSLCLANEESHDRSDTSLSPGKTSNGKSCGSLYARRPENSAACGGMSPPGFAFMSLLHGSGDSAFGPNGTSPKMAKHLWNPRESAAESRAGNPACTTTSTSGDQFLARTLSRLEAKDRF